MSRRKSQSPLVCSFPPIAAAECARVLILGTAPSIASLAKQQYYGHPQNAFWPIMGRLFGAERELPYDERRRIVTEQGVAVWDVLRECYREGSLDTSIHVESESPNDIAGFLRSQPNVHSIFFNGGKAETAFRRRVCREWRSCSASFATHACRPPARLMRAARSRRSSRRGERFLAPANGLTTETQRSRRRVIEQAIAAVRASSRLLQSAIVRSCATLFSVTLCVSVVNSFRESLTKQVQRLAEHAEDAFLVGALAHFVGREPGDVVRFVADVNVLVRAGDEQETHVVVLVRIFNDHGALRIAAFGDLMDVESNGINAPSIGTKSNPAMPDSSRASRRATSSTCHWPSAWPPSCSQRSSLR